MGLSEHPNSRMIDQRILLGTEVTDDGETVGHEEPRALGPPRVNQKDVAGLGFGFQDAGELPVIAFRGEPGRQAKIEGKRERANRDE